MIDMTNMARTAYAAYGHSTGNKNFRGEEMPTWDALPQAIRNAWVAAVWAVVDNLNAKLTEALRK